MSDAHKVSRTAFIILYVSLLIPGLNWIVGPLFAAFSGMRLLAKGQWGRLLGLLAGATLWGILSLYLLLFGTYPVVAIGMMLAFFGGTWLLLKLIEAWDMPDESVQVSLKGRIQS